MLGIEARDPERVVRSDTLVKLLAASRVRRQGRSEELRVLYVAMTRAKHRLVLVGTPKRKMAEWLEEQQQFWKDWAGPLPRQVVRYASCPLDWVVPALAARDEAGRPSLFAWREVAEPAVPTGPESEAVFVYPRSATDAWRVADQAGRPDSEQVLAALEGEGGAGDSKRDEAAGTAIARLTAGYPFEKLTRIPVIKPVTELKGRLRWDSDDDEDNPDRVRPRFGGGGSFGVPRRLRPNTSGDAARQRGTATHLFLEKVDLAGATDRAHLERQLGAMVDRKLLSAVEAEQVDLAGAAWFLNETEPGRLIRAHHTDVRREMPFVMRLEPERLSSGSGSDDLADTGIVRGVIDLLWSTPDGIDIADFKTDAVSGAELRRRIELYRDQLDIYATAIQRIWRRPVCRLWLAFLHPRHIEPFTPRALRG
jgi:ATP-dependent helicase/nuclease subunit A